MEKKKSVWEIKKDQKYENQIKVPRKESKRRGESQKIGSEREKSAESTKQKKNVAQILRFRISPQERI